MGPLVSSCSCEVEGEKQQLSLAILCDSQVQEADFTGLRLTNALVLAINSQCSDWAMDLASASAIKHCLMLHVRIF